jgi:hypothetical protein
LTTLQIIVMTALAVVIFFTRAPSRRVVGALAGGAAAGCLGLGGIVLGEALGMWRVFLPSTPGVLVLLYLGFVISCSPIYLITWRVVRRFSWRGLALCFIFVGVVGPPRDYLYTAIYPEWMVFAGGVAPVVADAATYVAIVALGHAVMWLVSGAARGSPLTRQRSGA